MRYQAALHSAGKAFTDLRHAIHYTGESVHCQPFLQNFFRHPRAGPRALDSAAELTTAIAAHFTPLSAYAFLVFILLYTPCVAALAAAKRELHSTKYFLLTIAIQLTAAYAVSALIYQVGRLFLG